MASFCPKCGTRAEDGTKFCGKCGTNLGAPLPPVPPVPPPSPLTAPPAAALTPAAPTPAVPSPGERQAPTAGKTSGGGCGKALIIGLVVVGLLILVGVGGAAYLAYRAKKKIDQVKEAINNGDVNDVANVLNGKEPGKAAAAMPTYPDWSSAGGSAVQPSSIPAAVAGVGDGATAEKAMGQVLPMRKGLRITTAIQQSQGDYESIKEIRSVTDEGVSMEYIADNIPETPNPFATEQENAAAKDRKRSVHSSRKILATDLQNSHEYAELFGETTPMTIPSTTALGISAASLNDLVTKGETPFTYQDTGLKGALGGLIGGLAGMADQMKKEGGAATPDDQKTQQAMKDLQQMGKVNCTLKRMDQKIYAFPVMLNDGRVQLPAVRANCKSDSGSTAEFYFLNDPQNPLSLTWKVGKSDRLQVVKLEYVQETAATTGAGGGRPKSGGGGGTDLDNSAGAKELEQKLEQQETVRIYGIYFDFASAQIKSQSKPTLDEIAAVMTAHPEWKLNVAGHTDNVGGDTFNMQLSQQRAESVKAALVTQYKIAADRLSTAGYGASSPVETNDTMEGRARNRRVELSKQ